MFRFFVPILIFACAWPVCGADFGAKPVSEEAQAEIRPWVGKLADPSWKVRQQAGEKILEFGDSAVDLLHEAADSDDLDLSRSARFYLAFFESGLARSYDPPVVKEVLEAVSRADLAVPNIGNYYLLAALPNAQGLAPLVRIAMAETDAEPSERAAICVFWALPYAVPMPECRGIPDPEFWEERNRQRTQERAETLTALDAYLRAESASTPGARLLRKLVDMELQVAAQLAQGAKPRENVLQVAAQTLDSLQARIWERFQDSPELENQLLGLSFAYLAADFLTHYGAPELAEAHLNRLRATPMSSLNSCQFDMESHRNLAVMLRFRLFQMLILRGRSQFVEAEARALVGTLQQAEIRTIYPRLAQLFHSYGEHEKAIALMKACLDSPFVQVTLGDEENFGERLRGLLALYSLEQAWLEGDFDKARKLADAGMEITPVDVDLLIGAWRMARARKDAEWLAAVDAKIDETLVFYEARTDVVSLNGFAWLAANTERRLDTAQELAERAVEDSQKSGSVMDTLAHVHFAQGRHDEAVRIQREAVERSPFEYEIRMSLERFEQSQRLAVPDKP